MPGTIAYILASLLIYYITHDWTWTVWSAAACLALFGVGLLMCRGRHDTRILSRKF